jgi:hypothetical protein
MMWRSQTLPWTASGATSTTTVGALFDAGGVQVGTSGVYVDALDQKFIAPIETTGAYFNGLVSGSSLKVTLIAYVEYFPSSDHPDTNKSHQSPTYDPLALQTYSRCLAVLPPGTQQTANPAGEWFRGVLDVVSKVAGPIGNALSIIPGMGFLGSVGTIVSKGAGSLATSMAKRGANTRHR